jgi:serine/threonine protein kinase
MKKTKIRDYRLTSDFTTAGGGQCRWAFAQKDGVDYFIKEFLTPTYPTSSSSCSEKLRERKLADCQIFSDRHRRINRKLSELSAGDGNVVVSKDIFRVDAHYYKVTDKIDVNSISVEEISKLARYHQAVLLKSLAHSVSVLHSAGLVHGDLKPDNILIKCTKRSYTTKLIDFDDSYEVEKLPPANQLVGDITYYSPEMSKYIRTGEDVKNLGKPSDIFSLGIIFCEYLTGHRPKFKSGSELLTTDVGVSRDLEIITGLEKSWLKAADLINSMLGFNPENRPTIQKVLIDLNSINSADSKSPKSELSGSGLIGKLRSASLPETKNPQSLFGKLLK